MRLQFFCWHITLGLCAVAGLELQLPHPYSKDNKNYYSSAKVQKPQLRKTFCYMTAKVEVFKVLRSSFAVYTHFTKSR
jgi:adenosylcobinamide amidohydrolase